jgi:hypothetical protein
MWNWMSALRDGLGGNFQGLTPNGQLCSNALSRNNSPNTPDAWKTTSVGSSFSMHLYDQASHGAGPRPALVANVQRVQRVRRVRRVRKTASMAAEYVQSDQLRGTRIHLCDLGGLEVSGLKIVDCYGSDASSVATSSALL